MKGGELIRGDDLRVVLTSPPNIDTEGIKVRQRSEKSLLYAREEGRNKKEGVCQEDTRIKGIPFEMGCLLIPVIHLQVYFVLTYWTIQGLYICQAAFV